MSCKRVDEFLAPYVLGSLEQRDLSRFNHHVDRCQACAQKVSEAGDTLVDLASAVPQKRVPERVKQQLLQHAINVEDFGGDVLAAEISAKTGQGVDDLLEKVLLAYALNWMRDQTGN